jgi:hypothetical protein
MVSTSTCFDTGVPSSGSLLEQRNTCLHANPGTDRPHYDSIPKHVAVDTTNFIYDLNCIVFHWVHVLVDTLNGWIQVYLPTERNQVFVYLSYVQQLPTFERTVSSTVMVSCIIRTQLTRKISQLKISAEDINWNEFYRNWLRMIFTLLFVLCLEN